MMITIFVRMMVELLAGVVGAFAGLVLIGIGQKQEAFSTIAICALVAWIVRPCAADRAAFAEFQKNREKFPG